MLCFNPIYIRGCKQVFISWLITCFGIVPAPLIVGRNGDDMRVELPPHPIAMVVLR